ncbi:MAG TPA: T9SS type A sorting domain-containing protein, partial [Ferruginibacter sp.]|nr:T9SS type A sorting domain-containing protein [Ferruginibacter sp.]
RIRQLDLNNTQKLSEIRIVDFGKKGFVNLYPNPVVNTLYLNTDIQFKNTPAKIFNSQGQLLSSVLLNGSGTISIPVNQLKPGTYIFQINQDAGNHKVKFIKK